MGCQYQYIDGTPVHFPLDELIHVGRNYAEHAEELSSPTPTEPLLSIKPDSCVVPMSGGLSLPQECGSVHYEAEITVLIGEPLSCKPNREEILDAISSYVPALGLALRGVQAKLKEKDLPWKLTKSFDSAGVLSPFVNVDQFPGPTDIGIHLTINGEVRQDDNSHNMLNPIVPLIQHIAGHFSLQTDNVVLTGTPFGVESLDSGNELLPKLPGASRFETRVL